MAQVSSTNTTRTPNDLSRRRFLAFTAGASALAAGSLAAAAMPAPASQCFLADDSELLQLEKVIVEARGKAKTFDDEILRLSEIWEGELLRLEAEFKAGRTTLTTRERWDAIRAMPESAEHDRLTKLQWPHWDRHDKAMDRFFSIPAQTTEGRAAKASVVLALMDDNIMTDEDEGDYPLNFVRKLLTDLVAEFVGVRPCES